ncbi:hypothetical protein F909_01306 [Acinetobacter sp. ANC 3929]|uniref:Uncharacterized protein n=2 Tax=Acinetobacter TaxID=469 RepID=S3TJB2_9GAMM|nr:hypothetical protein F909_04158 [Acinetobacter sp. ANC 3929]ENW82229.1 hypothetical protein F909_01306 [Acinetobacter sp. ANC 3929]ENX58695.1 hypothetical protein F902_01319 [Acinetobacter higginsii]EPG41088.1 hypothetical protein F907_00651 [Acinetobacter colistiniresistens]
MDENILAYTLDHEYIWVATFISVKFTTGKLYIRIEHYDFGYIKFICYSK